MSATQRPDWAPEGVDISRPNIARSYDYWLGGSHNFAVDREYAQKIMEALPNVRILAQANRAMLHRAVSYLRSEGVRQFLDLGSGIPTLGNVHEAAQRTSPDVRVVYVDIDPIAVAHSEQILADNEYGVALQADMCEPDKVLGSSVVRDVIDFSQPVGVLAVAVLHVIPDSKRPQEAVKAYRDAFPSGSHIVISHVSHEGASSDEMHVARELSQATPTPGQLRTRDEILKFFDGYELVEPGLVWGPQWRPDGPPEGDEANQMAFYAGVGRKP